MMDEMLRVVAEAVAEAETFAKYTEKATARATDLIATNQVLLLQARKVVGQARSRISVQNGRSRARRRSARSRSQSKTRQLARSRGCQLCRLLNPRSGGRSHFPSA